MWVACGGLGGATVVEFVGRCGHGGGGCGWQWVWVCGCRWWWVVDWTIVWIRGSSFSAVFYLFLYLVAGFLVEPEAAVMVVVVWWCCDDGCDGGGN